MSHPDAVLVYALARVGGPRGGLPRLLRRWREEQGRALGDLFERPEEALRALLFPAERALVAEARAGLAEASRELAALAAEGIRTLCVFDEAYPHSLRENMTAAALPLLFLKGDLPALRLPGMAIIGSRTVTEPAREYARAAARALAGAGCNVISGFAPGIDQAAYEGAVESGKTTVVLPQGIRLFLRDYSRVDRAAEAGRALVMSQFLPDTPWIAQQAIARNVSIHALADALVVIAAGMQGGTWFSACDALRRGRPVFVRRLPPEDRASPGNARLIEQGAIPLAPDAAAAAAEVLLRIGSLCRR